MPEMLALRYRPRTFADVVGQKAVHVVLSQMVKKDAVPHALLFEGGSGLGKTSTGRILAAALNCEAEDRPCTHCVSCKAVFAGNSPAVLEIDAASHGRVDDIRGTDTSMGLRERISFHSGGLKHVLLIDEAHSLTREACNALLKLLEEPPPGTVFILLTTEAHKLPATVVNRCARFTFRKIPPVDIISRLAYICDKENLQAESELLALIADRSQGGLRDAVMTLDHVTRVGISTAEQFMDLMGECDFGPILLKAVVAGNHAEAFSAIDEYMQTTGDPATAVAQLCSTLRDLLVLKSNGKLTHQGQFLEARRSLAATLELDQIVVIQRVMWDLITKAKLPDQRAMLELAVSLSIESLVGKRVVSASNGNGSSAKLTLDAMRELASR